MILLDNLYCMICRKVILLLFTILRFLFVLVTVYDIVQELLHWCNLTNWYYYSNLPHKINLLCKTNNQKRCISWMLARVKCQWQVYSNASPLKLRYTNIAQRIFLNTTVYLGAVYLLPFICMRIVYMKKKKTKI